jgi:hypothetical protein
MSDSPAFDDSHVIEIWGEAVGITVPEGDSVRFHAAAPHFAALDGRRFPTVGQARLAAVRHQKAHDSHRQHPLGRFDLTDSSAAFWNP